MKLGSNDMEGQFPTAPRKSRLITRIAGGCLAVLFLSFCTSLAVASYSYRYHIPYLKDKLPAPTKSISPTPHILVHQPIGNSSVISDDFSDNNRDWGVDMPDSKAEVMDGKLILQAYKSNQFTIATDRDNVLIQDGGKYYIQADFATDTYPNGVYGLVFGMDKDAGTFYLFDIQPQSSMFGLLKHTPGNWDTLIPLTSSSSKLMT